MLSKRQLLTGRILMLGLATQFGAGCVGMTHLTRKRSVDDDSAFFIDAKQRGVFTRKGTTCAEPSPDALSALAASQAFNLTSKDVTAAQSFNIAESAASIGLRTQSIQLMRDHMYRLCESYQNGAINAPMYQLLHRRFQTTMVGILAIEQLTGAVRAPAVILGSSSSSGNAEAVAKLTAMKETQLALVAEAEKDVQAKTSADKKAQNDLQAAQAAAVAAPNDADLKKAADAAKSAAEDAKNVLLSSQGALAGRKSALSSIDRSLVLAQASGSASATGVATDVPNLRAPGEIEAVSNAVSKIVTETMALKNQGDLCAVVLTQSASKNSGIDLSSPVFAKCLSFLDDVQRARLLSLE